MVKLQLLNKVAPQISSIAAGILKEFLASLVSNYKSVANWHHETPVIKLPCNAYTHGLLGDYRRLDECAERFSWANEYAPNAATTSAPAAANFEMELRADH